MVPYIDIHAHLDFPQLFPSLDEIIKNANNADVRIILTNGIDKKTNRASLEIAKKYSTVKPCLGFYPPDAIKKETGSRQFDWRGFEQELTFIRKNKSKIAAIGEIGMDYKEGKDKPLQKKVFTALIRLAKQLDKPIIVHSRRAEEDVINILEKEASKKVILHCFCGKKKLIEKAFRLKFYFSIPTNVIKAENIQNIVKTVPLNQLFAETDSPFLSPFREKQNQPSFVTESYKKIAEIKQLTLEEVKNNIFMNWQSLF
ncbi:YchF/TatD family DNA exonuclease [Candidatus Woesearchaeota archaeon]|nr:YchF/TatD family DNA exonuclease [Candidatus Woesearchaeota archaeon]